MDCNIESIKLPKWPCFTILDSPNRVEALQSVHWPGRLCVWANLMVEWVPKITVACTEYAPEVIRSLAEGRANSAKS